MATTYTYVSTDQEDGILALAAEEDGVKADEFLRRIVLSAIEQQKIRLRTAREQSLIEQAGAAIAQGASFVVSVDPVTGFPTGKVL